MPEPKYRVLIPGKMFRCTVCGTEYSGLNARNNAIYCWESHQDAKHAAPTFNPYLRRELEDILNQNPRAGVEYPDPYSEHPWRRVNEKNPDHNRIEMSKARHNAERKERGLYKWLRKLFPDHEIWRGSLLDLPSERPKRKLTPLQRLSNAFYHRRWESVKQAAYALARSEAIRAEIERLNIPDIIVNEIRIQEAAERYLELLKIQDMWDGQTESKKSWDDFMLKWQIDDILEENDNDEPAY